MFVDPNEETTAVNTWEMAFREKPKRVDLDKQGSTSDQGCQALYAPAKSAAAKTFPEESAQVRTKPDDSVKERSLRVLVQHAEAAYKVDAEVRRLGLAPDDSRFHVGNFLSKLLEAHSPNRNPGNEVLVALQQAPTAADLSLGLFLDAAHEGQGSLCSKLTSGDIVLLYKPLKKLTIFMQKLLGLPKAPKQGKKILEQGDKDLVDVLFDSYSLVVDNIEASFSDVIEG